jgi:hypothetical protein
MIRIHKYYEMQCALAAAAHLSDAELAELEEHASKCSSCRECIADMARVSRSLFLMQAKGLKSAKTPSGMQERFLERAAAAGIPMSRSTSTLFDFQFARVATVAILLTIAVSLGWKVFSASSVDRTPLQANSTVTPNPGVNAISGSNTSRSPHSASLKRTQFRRRSTALRRRGSVAVVHQEAENHQPYLALNRTLFAISGSPNSTLEGSGFWSNRLPDGYFTVGTHTPISSSFTRGYVVGFLGRDWQRTAGEHAFHLDPKVASLSFLDSRMNLSTAPRIPQLTFSPPVLHLEPSRTW